MTAQEIHKEVFEDFKTLDNKLDYLKSDFRKLVLRSSRYPISKTFECKTREKKNLFIVNLEALKRSDWKMPNLSVYGIFARPEGKYAVSLTLGKDLSTLYPPHFFKRYRERILKDDSISNDDLIRYYFKYDGGFLATVVNDKFEAIYHNFENNTKNDKISFVAATNQGCCFGERQGNISIVRTIISDDMLFEDQREIFMSLRKAYKEAMKDSYSISV